ncbi:MAG: IS30 family transposase [Actinomycetia bacterium]|nr:IS30 family transposase [Actinomycetes bacterium]
MSSDPEISWAELARRVDRHPTTVSREVARNGGRSEYRACAAATRAERCAQRPRQPMLTQCGPLRERVTVELRSGRSPDAIAADMAAENLEGRPCTETIYQALYAKLLDVKARDCLRTRRPKRRCRQARSENKRPALPNIDARPAVVNDRTEHGHWEADQIIGARNQSSMLTLTERVTRYSLALAMPNGYAAIDVLAGLVEAFEQIPAHLRKSVTLDQGSEWAQWETLAATYDLDVWFCDPHSPWQRGQIENQNRAWRWWFPRGTNLASIPQADINAAGAIINNQRRRNLHYQTPTALYAAASTVH